MRRAITALSRFGLGARPGEAATLSDPEGWLSAQLGAPAPAPLAGLGGSPDLIRELGPRMRSDDPEEREAMRQAVRDRFVDEMAARCAAAATTDAPFRERWVWFWSNHFTVSTTRREVLALAGPFEREAIRPHALGRFEDLLLAVVRHPAMLVYLDNVRSVGPGSPAGRRRGRGLNENLAREILELHTLGVGNYEQADVEGLARLLTGWTVDPGAGRFRFDPMRHEPGPKRLLGDSWSDGGEADGVEALRALARHPATARHVAERLARHFVADAPPAAAVSRLAATFTDTGGDLAALAEALIALPEAWSGPPKLRTPAELVLATARALGYREGHPMLASMRWLGQQPFGAPSPEGWPDTAAAWLGPEAVLTRVEWAEEVGRQSVDRVDEVRALADDLYGPALSARTARALAAPRERALALLLASPEHQRR